MLLRVDRTTLLESAVPVAGPGIIRIACSTDLAMGKTEKPGFGSIPVQLIDNERVTLAGFHCPEVNLRSCNRLVCIRRSAETPLREPPSAQPVSRVLLR